MGRIAAEKFRLNDDISLPAFLKIRLLDRCIIILIFVKCQSSLWPLGKIAEQSLMSLSAKVWEATQPFDENGRFFLDTPITRRPLPFQPDDGDMKEM